MQSFIEKIRKSDSCSAHEFATYLSFFNPCHPEYFEDLIDKAGDAKVIEILRKPHYPCSGATGDYSYIYYTGALMQWAHSKEFKTEEEKKTIPLQNEVQANRPSKNIKLDARKHATYMDIINCLEQIITEKEMHIFKGEFYKQFFSGKLLEVEDVFLLKIYFLVNLLITADPALKKLIFNSQNDLINYMTRMPNSSLRTTTLTNYFADANKFFNNIFTS